MIESVTREGAVWAEVPHKFEAGTVNAGGAYALAEAVRYMKNIGFDAIEAQENRLTRIAYEGMMNIPAPVTTAHRRCYSTLEPPPRRV